MPVVQTSGPARIPFPPRPRAWTELVDHIVASASECAHAVTWQAVHTEGMDHPWVGVQAPTLDNLRAWQWDVVTPEDHEHDALLRHDPLALPIEQDMMVVDIRHAHRAELQIRMQVPVRHVPTTIDVCASALPPAPWHVELSTGWSTDTIAQSVGAWLTDHVGHRVGLSPDRVRQPKAVIGDDHFAIGEDLWITGDAFDGLLSLDPADAGLITRTLTALQEALDPFR